MATQRSPRHRYEPPQPCLTAGPASNLSTQGAQTAPPCWAGLTRSKRSSCAGFDQPLYTFLNQPTPWPSLGQSCCCTACEPCNLNAPRQSSNRWLGYCIHYVCYRTCMLSERLWHHFRVGARVRAVSGRLLPACCRRQAAAFSSAAVQQLSSRAAVQQRSCTAWQTQIAAVPRCSMVHGCARVSSGSTGDLATVGSIGRHGSRCLPLNELKASTAFSAAGCR